MDKLGFSRSLNAATAMQGDPEGPGMMKRMKSGDLFTGHACVHIGVFLQPHPHCIELLKLAMPMAKNEKIWLFEKQTLFFATELKLSC